ncbi:hypothetical protein VTN31DRAFT_6973 [Thermomyces dupontii]|uniref:uncharacterized protein n=1 Tax=Talaromyces thermophilus TaxID=28565 RepID=UPI003743AFD2
MDWEIGHVNISMYTEEEKSKARKALAEKKNREADEGVAGCPWESSSGIVSNSRAYARESAHFSVFRKLFYFESADTETAGEKFLVDDIESEWAYESDPFDLIHARYLAGSIRDFGKLVKQCYRSVKPGGWVEFQDLDGYPMSPDGSLNGTALQQY